MTWQYVPEPSHAVERTDRVDWLGLGLLILGVGALQIMLERGEAHDWFASREIVLEGVLAVVGVVSFMWQELTDPDHPVVDLRVLRDRQLAAGVIFGAILGFALYASVFALPVFLQTLLGYTAWDTGRVILPGALASAVTMALAGKFANRIDARASITVGVLLFLWAMWMHYHFTTEIGMHDLFWPMILRGVGLGLIFVPLTNAAVATLSPARIPQGTGLFNLSRQLGGSMGIAVTATLIRHYSEQSRTALAAHVTDSGTTVRNWMAGTTHMFQHMGQTANEAAQHALALMDHLVGRQASVLAFEKIFLLMGITFTAALPLLLLFRTGKVMGGGSAH